MTSLFVLAALLATAHAATLGSDECTWGPSYWCRSVAAAGSCNAFAHCLDGVWSKTLVAFAQTEKCATGVSKVALARHLLVVKREEDSATHILTSLCTLVSDSQKRRECKETVIKHMPLALQLLTSSLKDEYVAWVLGLCDPLREDEPSVKPQSSADEQLCKSCHTFINDISSHVGKELQKVVENAICSELENMAPMCKILVENTVPELLDEITNEAQAGEFCRLAKFCSHLGEKPKVQELFKKTFRKLDTILSAVKIQIRGAGQRLYCAECNKIMTSVKFFEKDSPIRAGAENLFGKVCRYQGLNTRECGDLILEIFTVISSFLKESLEPSTFCGQTLQCLESEPAPAPHEDGVQIPASTSGDCAECEKLFVDVSRLFKEEPASETTAVVKQTLCQNAGSIQNECNAMMDRVLPLLFVYVSNTFTPTALCGTMGLCETGLSLKFDLMKVFNVMEGNEVQLGDFKCDECMAVVSFAQNLDRDPEVQNAVVKFFNDTCAKLGEEEKQCQALVAQYSRQLFELIASELDPATVCDLVLRCTKSVVEEPDKGAVSQPEAVVNRVDLKENALNVKADQSAAECTICRLALEVVDQIISHNRTEQGLEKTLQQVCGLLAPSVQQPCDQFVSSYTPTLVSLLLQELDPEVICSELQLCNDTSSKDPENPLSLASAQGSFECQLCQLVIGTVVSRLDGNKTQAAVTKALDEICGIMPTTIRPQCVSFVSEYAPALLELLADELDAQVICIKISLCSQARHAQATAPDAGSRRHAPRATPYCDVCNQAMQLLDSFLQQNRTEAAVTQALDQVCSFFPTTISAECRQFVGRYSPDIINLLVQELNVTDICKKLGLCAQTQRLAEELNNVAGEQTPTAGPICNLCKQILQQVDPLLEQNRTVDDIEKALDQVCRLFPPNISSQCRQFVAQYAQQVIEALAGDLKPEEVCSFLALCTQADSAQEITPIAVAAQQKPTAGLLCDVCQLLLQQVDNLLDQNRTTEDVERAVDQVCKLLPGTTGSQCRQLVARYAPQIIELLLQQLNPTDICMILDLCTQAGKASDTGVGLTGGQQKVSAGPICDLCKDVIHSLDTLLDKNRTVDDIEKELDQVCRLFPPNISSQCRQFVAQYTPQIIEALAGDLKPEEVCSFLALCSQSDTFRESSDKKESLTAEQQKVSAGPICDICKQVVQALDSLLKENRTVDDIEKALDQVCRLFPPNISSQCRQFVAQYTPQIIEAFAGDLKPEEVCSFLALCSQSDMFRESSDKKESLTAEQQKVSAGPICDICKQVVQALDSLLKENRTVDDIEKELDQVCRLFPPNISSQCRQFVAQYTPQIIEAFAGDLKPEQVCSFLELCSQGNTPTPRSQMAAKIDSDFECALCQMVFIEVNKLLGDNRTEVAIIKAVETVCDLLSGDLKIQCQSEVQNYGPAVIDLLQHMDDPDSICRAARLCQSQNVVEAEESKSKTVKEGEVCLICEILINYLDEGLNEPSAVQEVEKALNDVCNLLPADLKGECAQLVQQFTPLILQLLVEEISPSDICQAIKVCPSPNSTLHPRFLGIDSCTFGPAYWCAKMENAQKCGVVELCVKDYGLRTN